MTCHKCDETAVSRAGGDPSVTHFVRKCRADAYIVKQTHVVCDTRLSVVASELHINFQVAHLYTLVTHCTFFFDKGPAYISNCERCSRQIISLPTGT